MKRNCRNRRSIIRVVIAGILVGAIPYLSIVVITELGKPNDVLIILRIVLACGFCHAAWLLNTLFGWPEVAWKTSVLMINVVYYPLLFLLIRSITRRIRRLRVKDDAIRCVECRYDLTGNESCICPECGAAVEATA